MPFRFSFAVLVFIASIHGVFADEAAPERSSTGQTVAAPASQSGTVAGSGSAEDAKRSETERQKAMDDVNAFLIESYKIKLDRSLAGVYESVRVAAKDDPAVQAVLLRRILAEIESKVSILTTRPVSPNRKKILLAVFYYMRSEIESKVRLLE